MIRFGPLGDYWAVSKYRNVIELRRRAKKAIIRSGCLEIGLFHPIEREKTPKTAQFAQTRYLNAEGPIVNRLAGNCGHFF
jgi:hypothetical protein